MAKVTVWFEVVVNNLMDGDWRKMTFEAQRGFAVAFFELAIVATLSVMATDLDAKDQNPEVSFLNCNITIAELEAEVGALCSDQTGRIRFEILGSNRSSSGLMGDMTPVFNNFWRDNEGVPEYRISLVPFFDAPNVWQVTYIGGNSDILSTTFDFFVWSRNFSIPGVGRNDLAVPYGPTRTIKCLKEVDKTDPFRQCISYYTAMVCDSWHNKNNQPVTVVSYPTIAVRTESYEDSIFMMENFEIIQRTAESILSKILNLSCEL